jgi:hypothetical protein
MATNSGHALSTAVLDSTSRASGTCTDSRLTHTGANFACWPAAAVSPCTTCAGRGGATGMSTTKASSTLALAYVGFVRSGTASAGRAAWFAGGDTHAACTNTLPAARLVSCEQDLEKCGYNQMHSSNPMVEATQTAIPHLTVHKPAVEALRTLRRHSLRLHRLRCLVTCTRRNRERFRRRQRRALHARPAHRLRVRLARRRAGAARHHHRHLRKLRLSSRAEAARRELIDAQSDARRPGAQQHGDALMKRDRVLHLAAGEERLWRGLRDETADSWQVSDSSSTFAMRRGKITQSSQKQALPTVVAKRCLPAERKQPERTGC